jgi:hypothetical protein
MFFIHCELRGKIPVWTGKHLAVLFPQSSNKQQAKAAVANTHHIEQPICLALDSLVRVFYCIE